jgi:hypothetical protein
MYNKKVVQSYHRGQVVDSPGCHQARNGFDVGEEGQIYKGDGLDSYGRPLLTDAFPERRDVLIDHVRWTDEP